MRKVTVVLFALAGLVPAQDASLAWTGRTKLPART